MVLRYGVVSIVFLLCLGCSMYEINSVARWCEWILDENAPENHSPFWAVLPGWRYDADAIRADYVKILNDTYMEKVANRADRMVYAEGTDLHIVNLAVLMQMDPTEFVEGWSVPIESAKKGELDLESDPGLCVFNVGANFFDRILIHYTDLRGLERPVDEDISIIDTQRAERAKEIGGGGVLRL